MLKKIAAVRVRPGVQLAVIATANVAGVVTAYIIANKIAKSVESKLAN